MNKEISDTWTYQNPVKIISTAKGFQDALCCVPPGNVLLVTSQSFTKKGLSKVIIDHLKSCQITVFDKVTPNPELELIDNTYNELCEKQFSAIIALGGGSVIDTAKALSVLLSDPEIQSLSSFFRDGKKIQRKRKHMLIAIPTTSGTGSEVTPFATVWDSMTEKKLSLSGYFVYPTIAILDPKLTIPLPKDITLSTGLDSISHALESIWNINRSPLSLNFATHSLKLAAKHLPVILDLPKSLESRAAMQLASTYAGISISQTKTAIAHSISYPLTIKLGIPHGLAAGFCLVKLMEYFIANSQGEVSHLETFDDIRNLVNSLNLRGKILQYGNKEQIINLLPQMLDKSRANNFFIPVDLKFIKQIVIESL